MSKAPVSKEQDVTPAEDLQLPHGNSQSGTNFGYQVQARYMSNEPADFGGRLLDQRWAVLHFPEAPIGVPTHRGVFDWFLPASHCMTYEAAQALRWWFLANCVAGKWGGRLCVETRIVKFKITYNHEAAAIEVLEEDKDAWRKGTII